jgi:hypothetical protein
LWKSFSCYPLYVTTVSNMFGSLVIPVGKYSANPFFQKNIKKVRDTFELI